MNTCLSEVEARVVVDRMNYRADLLARIKNHCMYSRWVMYLAQLLVGMVLVVSWRSMGGDFAEGIILFLLYASGTGFMHIFFIHSDRRIDALTHLFEEP